MEDHSNSPTQQRKKCNIYLETDTAITSQNMREQEAVSYLERNEIYKIVDSLLGELLLRQPDDPYEYLIQFLDRCILTRDGLVDSPPPFCSQDIIRRVKQANLLTIPDSMIKNKQETFEWKNTVCEKSYFKNMLYK